MTIRRKNGVARAIGPRNAPFHKPTFGNRHKALGRFRTGRFFKLKAPLVQGSSKNAIVVGQPMLPDRRKPFRVARPHAKGGH
ncbi:hypothetical protein [Spirosoma endbachense]|uniref:hypothetical protein n=1 Tax=Spirosoma endbachense TaxID=2666025 RepID=UPI001E37A1D2|nr:hypothetical protein [Spirosoma endbachense]